MYVMGKPKAGCWCVHTCCCTYSLYSKMLDAFVEVSFNSQNRRSLLQLSKLASLASGLALVHVLATMRSFRMMTYADVCICWRMRCWRIRRGLKISQLAHRASPFPSIWFFPQKTKTLHSTQEDNTGKFEAKQKARFYCEKQCDTCDFL